MLVEWQIPSSLRTNPKYTGFKEHMETTLTKNIPRSGKAIVDIMKRAKIQLNI